MRFYADDPVRRTRQLTGDALVLAWVVLWVAVGRLVHDQVSRLAAPGRTLEEAGRSLEDGLRAAGDGVARTPLLGEELRAPFDAAGGAASSITDAGLSVQSAVSRAALVAALAVAVWPVVVVVGTWVWHRLRSGRRAAVVRSLTRTPQGTDLLALRTLGRARLSDLARLGPDPAGAWRRGDPDVVHALAALGAREVGVRVPRAPVLGAAD